MTLVSKPTDSKGYEITQAAYEELKGPTILSIVPLAFESAARQQEDRPVLPHLRSLSQLP